MYMLVLCSNYLIVFAVLRFLGFLSPTTNSATKKKPTLIKIKKSPKSTTDNASTAQDEYDDEGMNVAACTTLVVSSPDIADEKLMWHPVSISGVFKDHDLSKKMFCNILLPSGIVDPGKIKMLIVENSSKLKIVIAMPSIMQNSYALHKDTFVTAKPTDKEINQNLRVANYNEALENIQAVKGEKVWWTAYIDLPTAVCTSKFLCKKYFYDNKTHALVACVDMLVEDSTYIQDKESFEMVESSSGSDK